MTDIHALIAALRAEQVRFVVIGAVALSLRGGTRVTFDLDVCYERSRDNAARLERALVGLHPRMRGAAPELPFVWDRTTIRSGSNFTLTTDLGDLDLLGEVTGLGGYAETYAVAGEVDVDGEALFVLTLAGLERAKRAAGRAKDLIDLAEITALRERGGV